MEQKLYKYIDWPFIIPITFCPIHQTIKFNFDHHKVSLCIYYLIYSIKSRSLSEIMNSFQSKQIDFHALHFIKLLKLIFWHSYLLAFWRVSTNPSTHFISIRLQNVINGNNNDIFDESLWTILPYEIWLNWIMSVTGENASKSGVFFSNGSGKSYAIWVKAFEKKNPALHCTIITLCIS